MEIARSKNLKKFFIEDLNTNPKNLVTIFLKVQNNLTGQSELPISFSEKIYLLEMLLKECEE